MIFQLLKRWRIELFVALERTALWCGQPGIWGVTERPLLAIHSALADLQARNLPIERETPPRRCSGACASPRCCSRAARSTRQEKRRGHDGRPDDAGDPEPRRCPRPERGRLGLRRHCRTPRDRRRGRGAYWQSRRLLLERRLRHALVGRSEEAAREVGVHDADAGQPAPRITGRLVNGLMATD